MFSASNTPQTQAKQSTGTSRAPFVWLGWFSKLSQALFHYTEATSKTDTKPFEGIL